MSDDEDFLKNVSLAWIRLVDAVAAYQQALEDGKDLIDYERDLIQAAVEAVEASKGKSE